MRDLMRSIAIIAFLALLAMPCMAEPESVTTGPYTVAFDLAYLRKPIR